MTVVDEKVAQPEPNFTPIKEIDLTPTREEQSSTHLAPSPSNLQSWRTIGPRTTPLNAYASFQTWKNKPEGRCRESGRRRNVCGACIINQNHVLLVKQREVQKWGFPKGSREWQESKLSCMTRELLEETGLELKNYEHEFLGYKTFFESTIYFYKLLEDCTSIILTPLDTHEIEESKWVPLSELKGLTLNRVTNHIRRSILLKPDLFNFVRQLCKYPRKFGNSSATPDV